MASSNAVQEFEKRSAAGMAMRQPLPRVPMDRIAVLIGAKGATAKSLRHAAGCKTLDIDSNTGDVEVEWGAPGSYDPVKAMKFPDVIKAIGRGMAPKAAIRLLDDDHFFELVDIRSFVGKRSNQQRRIRARIIGSQGKIRKLIENLTDTQITIYNSTVVLVGEEDGLAAARQAIEMLAGGAEHGTVLRASSKHLNRLASSSQTVFFTDKNHGGVVDCNLCVSQVFDQLANFTLASDDSCPNASLLVGALSNEGTNVDEFEEVIIIEQADGCLRRHASANSLDDIGEFHGFDWVVRTRRTPFDFDIPGVRVDVQRLASSSVTQRFRSCTLCADKHRYAVHWDTR